MGLFGRKCGQKPEAWLHCVASGLNIPLFVSCLFPQYTLNGKKVEVAVKQVMAGRAVEHRGAFSNPETLDLYRNIPELQDF